jgi:hypothetical protein
VMVDGGTVHCIRRREELTQLIGNETRLPT